MLASMDRRLEIRTAWRRVSNSMVSPDLMTWKQPRVDSLRHTSYATASRSCQLAGTFSWSAVWSFVGRGHNWDPSAPCCEYYLLTLLWVTLWNRAWHTHTWPLWLSHCMGREYVAGGRMVRQRLMNIMGVSLMSGVCQWIERNNCSSGIRSWM